ncbi:hypothetical protein B0T16DRAFT_418870 [Cercophora newfieldiana]|uniref:Uncharacterized protein n=1 Tax=Cercophora newfieldiana TaxID=92897 RepID=A0AA39XVE7_9PEZI|nr:hypothetical protein B0T16DRAFT_418870 [Cercophora newfieldiana]
MCSLASIATLFQPCCHYPMLYDPASYHFHTHKRTHTQLPPCSKSPQPPQDRIGHSKHARKRATRTPFPLTVPLVFSPLAFAPSPTCRSASLGPTQDFSKASVRSPPPLCRVMRDVRTWPSVPPLRQNFLLNQPSRSTS